MVFLIASDYYFIKKFMVKTLIFYDKTQLLNKAL